MQRMMRLINIVEQKLDDVREDREPSAHNELEWQIVGGELQEVQEYLEKHLEKFSYRDENRRWRIGLGLMERAALNLEQASYRYFNNYDSGLDWSHFIKVKKHLRDARYQFAKSGRKDVETANRRGPQA